MSKYDIVTVGETPGVTPDDAKLYTGKDRHELNMVFQFEHMDLGNGPLGKWSNLAWKLTDLKRILSKWQNELEEDGWNSLYWDNHDQPRVVSRFGNDSEEYREASAKMLGTCLHMMKGTPYIYQGEELGMTNVSFPSIDYYKDIEIINTYHENVVEKGMDSEEFLKVIHARGRDNARTPFHWDDTDHAGFTTGTPWINVNPNFKQINAKQQLKNPESVFHYYKKLIELRKRHEIIVYGKYDLLLPDDEAIFAFTRTLEDQKLLVICNFSKETLIFTFPENEPNKQLLICNYVEEENEDQKIKLRPYEARVYIYCK